MKQRKLKSFVMPTLYAVLLVLVFGTITLVSSFLNNKPTYTYSTGVLKEISTPVVETVEQETFVIKPYISDKVTVLKGYYDIKADETSQQDALIYFENTYMKNTGIMYTSTEQFDSVAVLDGEVTEVKTDELLGKVVVVNHTPKLTTTYYSLGEVMVKVGDTLKQGDVIGTSGVNKISEGTHNMLFEVNFEGSLINPNELFIMDVEKIN